MELYHHYTDKDYGCVINHIRRMFSKSTRSRDNLNHILQIKSETNLNSLLEQHKFRKEA